MANYKEIQGFPIQNLSSDPVPYAQALADNPYAGAWASGGALNTARTHVGGAGISNNSALAFGGSVPPGSNLVENYDGTSWSEVNELNNGRTYADGAGTATAALAIGGAGGSTPSTAGYVESWDGTNWTEVGDLTRGPAGPQSTVYGMGSGIQTSALYYGGDEGSSNALARTESWNGSSWTEVGDLNQARSYGAGIGTSNTSALCATGIDWAPGSSQNSNTNEEYNGTSWTELAEANQGRGFLGCGNYGSVTSALIFGGRNQGPSALFASTESWNGSAWTEVADLATARLNAASGSGTATAAMFAGGGTPSVTAVSEEWSFSGLDPSTTPAADYSDAIVGQMYYNSTTGQFKAIKDGGAPIGTWSSGGTMNTSTRYFSGGAGTKTAAIAFGGESPRTANTELYDGSSWTEVNNLNATKSYVAGSGTQTAALSMNGYTGTVNLNQVESWDGTNWTETTETNVTANAGNVACGTQTATLITMRSSSSANTELWDGSSWTEVNDLNTARSNGAVAGIYTDAIATGNAANNNVETWNGTSWTEVAEINTARQSVGSSGASSTSVIIFASNRPGGSPSLPGNASSPFTEFWDGTSWTEVNDMSTARYGGSSSKSGGTSSSAHAAGGYTGTGYTGVTEEWSAADFEIKTMTTS